VLRSRKHGGKRVRVALAAAKAHQEAGRQQAAEDDAGPSGWPGQRFQQVLDEDHAGRSVSFALGENWRR